VANNSPARAGLVKGGSWGISIKREKKSWKKIDPKTEKTRAKTGSRNTEQKNKTQKREGKVKE